MLPEDSVDDKAYNPIAVLSDKDASPYIDGAAFHLYGGDISALSSVRSTFPTKNVYFRNSRKLSVINLICSSSNSVCMGNEITSFTN